MPGSGSRRSPDRKRPPPRSSWPCRPDHLRRRARADRRATIGLRRPVASPGRNESRRHHGERLPVGAAPNAGGYSALQGPPLRPVPAGSAEEHEAINDIGSVSTSSRSDTEGWRREPSRQTRSCSPPLETRGLSASWSSTTAENSRNVTAFARLSRQRHSPAAPARHAGRRGTGPPQTTGEAGCQARITAGRIEAIAYLQQLGECAQSLEVLIE